MHIGYWWESEKRPLGRPRRRWVGSIKMDLRETGWDGVDWIDMAQHRDQWRAREHGIEPSGSIKFWEVLNGCTTGSFSRRAQIHEVGNIW
jgi:hypothetical protein